MPAFLLIALAIGGTHTFEHLSDENRYPARIEYALIDQCISSYDNPFGWDALKKKRDACINALEQTQEEFSYSDFKDEQKRFFYKFREHALASSFK
jgi:hypothetical protein